MSKEVENGEPIPVEEVGEGDELGPQEGQEAAAGDESCMQEITFFTHVNEAVELVAQMAAVCPEGYNNTRIPREDAAVFDKFEFMLKDYQEVPQVVRPHLEKLIPPLVGALRSRMPSFKQLQEELAHHEAATKAEVKLGGQYTDYDGDATKTSLHHLARAVYVLAKVTGNTAVTGHFPHEVMMMENVFYCLVLWQQDSSRHREWEMRYCMLLWLSNLILAPFALQTIDSNAGGDLPLSFRMLKCAQGFLSDPSKCREGAALFIGRMMTRPDAAGLRENFFTFAAKAVASLGEQDWTLAGGTLLALATTLKLGKRLEMLEMALEFIPMVAPVALTFPDATVCKTAVKAVQRLGLVCLPQRPAGWRYQRDLIDLEKNLTGAKSGTPEAEQTATEGDDDEVPEILEEVINILLNALSHQDTIVRWSAAKGVGRVCERLPMAAADDIVAAVLTVFDVKENDSGWHGGCLALAELAKRSVLLPSRLNDVIEIVQRALQYDVARGSYSVGSHVRDAACYVCWSIARAYKPSDLTQWAHQMSVSLVTASVFDREVNVRRASSAAFQECVGRLGTFPNGIDLVTTMDFFALATLRHSYLDIAPQVAVFDTYTEPLIDHLVGTKLYHWDRNVRVASAESVGKIVPILSQKEALAKKLTEQVIPALLAKAVSPVIPTRHGAIAALANIVATLPASLATADRLETILGVLPKLHSKRLFRGRGGELVRQVCCDLIKAFADRQLALPTTVPVETVKETKKVPTEQFLIDYLEECWKQPLEWLQTDAVSALKPFAAAYLNGDNSEKLRTDLFKKLILGVGESKAPNERRGCLLALGVVPPSLYRKHAPVASQAASASDQASPATALAEAFATLKHCTKLESAEEARDAESRRNAVQSLVSLTIAVGTEAGASSSSQETAVMVTECLDAMWMAIDDYAVDKRGDVGSYVRTEAMRGMESILKFLATNAPTLLTTENTTCCLGAIVKQSAEKIDRIRGIAGAILVSIVDHIAACPASANVARIVPHFEVLRSISDAKVLDWSSPSESFPVLLPHLLHTASYHMPLLEGLVLSVGGLSAHVTKVALPEILNVINSTNDAKDKISTSLLNICRKYQHNDRVVVPLYTAINRILMNQAFSQSMCPDLLACVEDEAKHFNKDVQRLLPLIPVIASLCLLPITMKDGWKACLGMIAGRYPKVRATVGTELFTALVAVNGQTEVRESTPGIDEAMEVLGATQWDGTDAPAIRAARDKIYPLLGVTKPVAAPAAQPTKMMSKKADGSYAGLVAEAGY